MNTTDIKNLFVEKYQNGEFRILKGDIKTVEIQNAHFTCDKGWILRKPNYDYARREVEWYRSCSLNVNDIPGETPKIWKECATKKGWINSNYGWMIWSHDNYDQYDKCLDSLLRDNSTRQAVMLYNRPSMQYDATYDGMHDFCCTYAVQCFLNTVSNYKFRLKYIVYMRSNDAVFGFNNDYYWHKTVQQTLIEDLKSEGNLDCIADPIEWNAGSLHVYERHFNLLEE